MDVTAEYPIDHMHMVEAKLASKERIRWTGRPHWWRFVPATIPRFIFGIVFAAAAVSILIEPLREGGWGGRLFLLVFALPFVLIAFALLSSPLWAIRRAHRTLYLVTDRRAITFVRGVSSTSIRSFGPEHLTELERNEKQDGSGDILFMSVLKGGGRREPKRRQAAGYASGFYGIQNVKEVEAMLKEVRAHADARSQSAHTEGDTD